jgi:hypothetical protein
MTAEPDCKDVVQSPSGQDQERISSRFGSTTNLLASKWELASNNIPMGRDLDLIDYNRCIILAMMTYPRLD